MRSSSAKYLVRSPPSPKRFSFSARPRPEASVATPSAADALRIRGLGGGHEGTPKGLINTDYGSCVEVYSTARKGGACFASFYRLPTAAMFEIPGS
eukprot:77687-Prorocentrum_minimum.AAC.1